MLRALLRAVLFLPVCFWEAPRDQFLRKHNLFYPLFFWGGRFWGISPEAVFIKGVLVVEKFPVAQLGKNGIKLILFNMT